MGVWPIPQDDILYLRGWWHILVPLGPYPLATTAFGRFGVCAFGGLQQDATGAMCAWLCRSDGAVWTGGIAGTVIVIPLLTISRRVVEKNADGATHGSDGSSSLENRQRMADKQPIGNC